MKSICSTHRFTAYSTAALLVAGFPIYFASPAAFSLYFGIALLRLLVLFTVGAVLAKEPRSAVLNDILRTLFQSLRKRLHAFLDRVPTLNRTIFSR